MNSLRDNLRGLSGWFANPGEPTPSFLLHINLAVFMVGMVIIVLQVARSGQDTFAQPIGILILSCVLLSFSLTLRGSRRINLSPAILVAMAVTILSGLVSTLIYQHDYLTVGIPWLVILLARCYFCLLGIPGSRDAHRARIERVVLFWGYAACTLVVVESLFFALRSGVSLANDQFLAGEEGNTWMNPNSTGLYCACAIMLSLIAGFVPRWIRLVVSGLSIYCLILSQSRTSLFALAAALLAWLFTVRGKGRLLFLWLGGVAFACVLFSNPLEDALRSSPQIERFLEKIESSDPRTNMEIYTRMDIVEVGLRGWAESPVIGQGFNGTAAKLENGYLSLACETGAVGLAAYLFLLAIVLKRAFRLLRTPLGSRSFEIGKYLFVTTVFVIIHPLGERTHGLMVMFTITNLWIMLVAISCMKHTRWSPSERWIQRTFQRQQAERVELAPGLLPQ